LPNDDVLLKDIKELVKVYEQLVKAMGVMEIDQFMDYLLSLEEIEDTQFQSDVQSTEAANTPQKPRNIPQQFINESRKGWKRDSSIAKEALINSGYSCEIDSKHMTFVSQVTRENFVEAHHLI